MADAQLAHDLDGTEPMLMAIHGITENRRFWDPVDLGQYLGEDQSPVIVGHSSAG